MTTAGPDGHVLLSSEILDADGHGIDPSVRVNGERVACGWGQLLLSRPPGQYEFTWGRAAVRVPVTSGATTHVRLLVARSGDRRDATFILTGTPAERPVPPRCPWGPVEPCEIAGEPMVLPDGWGVLALSVTRTSSPAPTPPRSVRALAIDRYEAPTGFGHWLYALPAGPHRLSAPLTERTVSISAGTVTRLGLELKAHGSGRSWAAGRFIDPDGSPDVAHDAPDAAVPSLSTRSPTPLPITTAFEPADLPPGYAAVHLDVSLFLAHPNRGEQRRRYPVGKVEVFAGRPVIAQELERYGRELTPYVMVAAPTAVALPRDQQAVVTVDGRRCALGYGQWLVPVSAAPAGHEFRMFTAGWQSSVPVNVTVPEGDTTMLNGQQFTGSLWHDDGKAALVTSSASAGPTVSTEVVHTPRAIDWTADPRPPAGQGLIELRQYCLCPPDADCAAPPTVTIDGLPVRGDSGRWVYPYPPGKHEIVVSSPTRTATETVDVDEGQVTALDLLHRPDVARPLVIGAAGESHPKRRHFLPPGVLWPLLALAAIFGVPVIVWLVSQNLD